MEVWKVQGDTVLTPHHWCSCVCRQRCWVLVRKLLLIVWRIDARPRRRVLLVGVTSRARMLCLGRPVRVVKLALLWVHSGLLLGLKG